MVLKWKRVALDIAIIFALTAIGGFVIAMGRGMGVDMTDDSMAVMIALSNILLGSLGFAYSAYKTRDNRWAHLVAVGVGVWLLSFVNVLLGFAELGNWIISIMPLTIIMGLGGGIGTFFSKKKTPTPMM